MAKDFITGKSTKFGNKRSHALNSTRRSWKPNLQKATILVNGKPKKVYVSARTLKSGKVTRVNYIKSMAAHGQPFLFLFLQKATLYEFVSFAKCGKINKIIH